MTIRALSWKSIEAIFQHCTVAFLILVCLVQAAYTADLSAAWDARESGASSGCFASLWNWVNASVSDCPLTYGGLTLYGTLDVGYGYDTAGVRFGNRYDKGVFYTVQKTSGAARWSWSPNALSASTLGVKVEEPIGGDWLLIGAAELAYNPFSLVLGNGPESLADNNLNPPVIRLRTATQALPDSGTTRLDLWASAARPMAR